MWLHITWYAHLLHSFCWYSVTNPGGIAGWVVLVNNSHEGDSNMQPHDCKSAMQPLVHPLCCNVSCCYYGDRFVETSWLVDAIAPSVSLYTPLRPNLPKNRVLTSARTSSMASVTGPFADSLTPHHSLRLPCSTLLLSLRRCVLCVSWNFVIFFNVMLLLIFLFNIKSQTKYTIEAKYTQKYKYKIYEKDTQTN